MIFGVFGLTACNNDTLDAYKEAGKTAIQTYADAKGQDNYCLDSWTVICNAAIAGKTAVDAAKNKENVDAAVATAKAEIDEVRKDGVGMFYTLQEAYSEGLLTVVDLQKIANHFNNNTLPADTLSTEIETAIKETAAENMRNDQLSPIADAKATDFLILKYFGKYNGSVAVIINEPYSEHPMEIVNFWFEVAGVSFNQRGHNPITIYK